PRWCVDGGLNISTQCLDRHLKTAGSRPALIWEGEESATRSLSYAQLHAEVARCASALRAARVGPRDTIGIHLPMVPETVIVLLAAAHIGPIAMPLFSGFGAAAIETRLQDVGARLLFTCDAFPRRGRAVPAKPVADQALLRCRTVE